MAAAVDYRAQARVRLLDLLDREHAVVKPEALARLAEGQYRGTPGNIDPHHVGGALNDLVEAGRVISTTAESRGKHSVTTFALAQQWKRKTAVAAAERRKRALYSRYLSWAQGSSAHPQGRVGPAGEAATRGGIIASATMQPLHPNAAGFSSILGTKLPGPVDSGGFMTPLVKDIPGNPVTVLVEVKNVRQWIYPNNSELYQVLYKAVFLQNAHPDRLIVPILICRAAHPTIFYMAKQLGFAVIAMDAQFIGDVDQDRLDEVRNELFFHDIRAGQGPSLRVSDRLKSIAQGIGEVAGVWQQTAQDSDLSSLITTLKATSIRATSREQALNSLRDRSRELGGRGGW